jgi:hypothetical protein
MLGTSLPFLTDDNLIDRCPWSDQGYTVAPFLDPDSFARLRACMHRIIYDIAREGEHPVDRALPLEQYHRVIGDDPWMRGLLLRQAQFYDERITVPLADIVERVSEICGVRLKAKTLQETAAPLFCLRVVPPDEHSRVSPFHRDVWLDCYLGTISLWVPLAGCNERSSLRVLSGSHFWPDAEVDMEGFSARGWSRSDEPIRPNPKPNEALVFTSHLLHGFAQNTSGETRVSMEMRLCRA